MKSILLYGMEVGKLTIAYFPKSHLVGGEIVDPAPGTSLPVLTAAPCSGHRGWSSLHEHFRSLRHLLMWIAASLTELFKFLE